MNGNSSRTGLIVFACLAFASVPVAAQTSGQGSPAPAQASAAGPDSRYARTSYSIFRADYWLEYIEDGAKILTSPLRWDERDWVDAGFVGVVTGGLFLLDEEIKDFWQGDLKSGGTDEAANIFQAFGDRAWIVPALPVAYVAGGFLRYGLKDTVEGARLQETALLSAESFLLAAGLTEGIKRLSGRARPNQSLDNDDFEGPGGGKSFPSGHATHAFAIASVVASEYQHSVAIRVGAYTFATLASLARINDNKHWASDLFLGAALGYFIGKFVYEENPFHNDQGFTLLPTASTDTVGLELAYRF